MASNTFFLTLNTTVVTAIGIFWKNPPSASPWYLAPVLIVALGQCFVWERIVTGYRTLNSAKYSVIRALEKKLPALPFSYGEWVDFGSRTGSHWAALRITVWERLIPLLFGATYILGFALAVASS